MVWRDGRSVGSGLQPCPALVPVPDVCEVLGDDLSGDVHGVWARPRNWRGLKGQDACQEPGAPPLLHTADPLLLLTDCLAPTSQTPAEEMLE